MPLFSSLDAWINSKSISIYPNFTFKLFNDLNINKGLFLCKKSSIINESCTFDNDCRDWANLVCNQNKCICNDYTTEWSGYLKKCIKHYGEKGCSSNNDCDRGLICNKSAGNMCMCPYLNGSEQYLNTLSRNCSIRRFCNRAHFFAILDKSF